MQFTSGIPRKNSRYLHTKQSPPWLHVSIFTLTILRQSNVPDTKNPHIRKIPLRPSVHTDSVLFMLYSKKRIRIDRKKMEAAQKIDECSRIVPFSNLWWILLKAAIMGKSLKTIIFNLHFLGFL